MRKLLFVALLLIGCSDGIITNRVPNYLRIVPTTITDSVIFDVYWAPVNNAPSYDFTFRTMPRIKQLEMVRVTSDTMFSVRVHKNDIPYTQITVYATAIASLSNVREGWVPAYDKPPPPPDTVVIDTIRISSTMINFR